MKEYEITFSGSFFVKASDKQDALAKAKEEHPDYDFDKIMELS